MTNEYVEKFGYRKYEGKVEPRWKRIWSLVWFELISTWHKSTMGKILLIIVIVVNLMVITFGSLFISAIIEDFSEAERSEAISTLLHSMVGSYLSMGQGPGGIVSGNLDISFEIPLGFLIIGLIGIAGSGSFADDKQGRVMEVYLSRIQRVEYALGKIGAIILYVNIFTTLPLLVMGGLYIQALGENHLDYLYFYAGVILFGQLASFLLGLTILLFSSVVEKRMYASLGFFLFYLIGSIFGIIIAEQEPSNEFLLLISPSSFLQLLSFICLGDFELYTREEIGHNPITGEWLYEYTPFLLNDGGGLEAYHILGLTFFLILGMFLLLIFRLRRLTTEELT